MKQISLILLFIIIAVSGFGQNVDSLYHLYLEARGDRRITLANEMAKAVHALECTDTLFHINSNAKPELIEAIVNELMASYAFYALNDFSKSITYSLDAAKLYEQTGDISAMDLNYSNAANNYFRMGDYEKAIDLMLKCYELEKELNDPEALSTTLNSLGVFYSTWGNHETAIEYFRRAVEIERPLNRPMQYAGRLSNLARELSLTGNHAEALALIKEALVHDEKIERNERMEQIARHQRIMGNIYVTMDSLPQAEKCYLFAIQIFEENNRQQPLAESLLSLGHLQLRQHRFAETAETMRHCIRIAEENRLLRNLRDANHLMYETYKQTGNTTQALSYLEQYRVLNDSIFKETTQQQLSEFRVRYETAEKELEIERQQTEISKHRTRQNIFIGGLLTAGLLVVLLVYIVMLRTRRNRELAEANATKDKFFSIISHDLKNPAIAQRDALQLLMDNSDDWNVESLKKFYGKLLRSADSQVDLLYSLLNWAQVQTGRMPFKPDVIDLAATLRTDLELLQNIADGKGVDLQVQLPPQTLVTADSDMLSLVVRNLVINAIKFTPSGGQVTLNVETDNYPSLQKRTRVTVSDTGIGMTEEQVRNLFRLDRKQSRRGTAGETGSGLGLIVCRELLEKHGATLFVESEKGKGSRFWFMISSVEK